MTRPGRGAKCSLLALSLLAGGLSNACTADALPPSVRHKPFVTTPFHYRSGSVYTVTFREPVDPGSLLAPMDRPAVILKADDIGRPVQAFTRYFEMLDARGLRGSAGLIADRLTDASEPATDWLKALPQHQFELWLDGLDHKFADGSAEFLRSGLDHQLDHLRRGLELAREVLDLELTAFGAPGNAWDDDTAAALAQVPQLQTIFHGPQVPGRLLLIRGPSAETTPGKMSSPAVFAEQYAKIADPSKPLSLQLHPTGWDEADFTAFSKMLDLLVSKGRFFTTPTGYHRWLLDRGCVVVRAAPEPSDRSAALDLTGCRYDHALVLQGEVTDVRDLAQR